MRNALDDAWELSPEVALRDESFGALAYNFTTRRLTFLKTRTLVDVVRRLSQCSSLREALVAAGVDRPAWAVHVQAIAALESGDMVRRRPVTP